jgi:uncharacterized protein YwqG
MDAFINDLRSIDIDNLSIPDLTPICESIVDFLLEWNDNIYSMDISQLEEFKKICEYICIFISTIFHKNSKINNYYRTEKDKKARKQLKELLKELEDMYKSISKDAIIIIEHIEARIQESNRAIEIENYKTILFSNLTYLDIHYIAELEKCNQLTKTNEITELEHIGGYPSLTKTENWPTTIHGDKLTFIAQFMYNKNNLYRIFADLNDKMSNYYSCMPIPITENSITPQFGTNMKLIYPENEYPILNKYKVTNWIEHKVLKPYCEIQHDIKITQEEYNKIELDNELVGFTVIRFPEKMPSMRELDKLPLCKIPADLLGQKNDGENYHFYHQGRMEFI